VYQVLRWQALPKKSRLPKKVKGFGRSAHKVSRLPKKSVELSREASSDNVLTSFAHSSRTWACARPALVSFNIVSQDAVPADVINRRIYGPIRSNSPTGHCETPIIRGWLEQLALYTQSPVLQNSDKENRCRNADAGGTLRRSKGVKYAQTSSVCSLSSQVPC